MDKKYDIDTGISDNIDIDINQKFPELDKMVTQYDDSYCGKIIAFARKGYFLEGFGGHFNISTKVLYSEWLNINNKQYENFQDAFKTSQSLLIFYYNNKLLNMINTGDTEMVGVIRSILTELLKSIPDEFKKFSYSDWNPETDVDRAKRVRINKKGVEYNAFAVNSGAKVDK